MTGLGVEVCPTLIHKIFLFLVFFFFTCQLFSNDGTMRFSSNVFEYQKICLFLSVPF